MEGVSVIRSPWNEKFKTLVSDSDKFDFASPFIKTNAIHEIIKSKTKVRGITVFSIPRFIKKSSDIEAIEQLVKYGVDIRSFGSLHAKIYIFDNAAIVTSANLTQSGLSRNTEYGVIISNETLLSEIVQDFEHIFNNSSKIRNQLIKFARKAIDSVSPEQRRLLIDFDREVLPDDEIITESLSGWMKEVYQVVLKLPDDDFSLESIYECVTHFSNIYPRNQNIEAKIRQTLQHLRNMDLVEFLDNRGNYRRRR